MIIAHRMRTIAGADKIVVIKDGKSDEQGTPEKQSVRNRLRQLQAESKQRRTHNRHSQDRER